MAESFATTGLVINFYSIPQDAVSAQAIEDLKSQLTRLEKAIRAEGDRTQAQKCHDEFQRNWEQASTLGQKTHCLLTYAICLGHGFNISIPIKLG